MNNIPTSGGETGEGFPQPALFTDARTTAVGTLAVGLLLVLILTIYFGLGRERGPMQAAIREAPYFDERIDFMRAVPSLEERRSHLWGLRGYAPQLIVDELGPGDILLLPPVLSLRNLVGRNDASWADPRWIASLADLVPCERYPDEGWERATHALITYVDQGEMKIYMAILSDPKSRLVVTSLWDRAMVDP